MTASIVFAAVQAMTFSADRIAADNVTQALTATGHVVATLSPLTLRSEEASRDKDGRMLFRDPTCATTCTNAVGHTHWNVSGELEYKEREYVILRNAWLEFYEIPILWLPYMYYPLDWDCGFSWMPGYTGRWGAFLLTKYAYHLAGDPSHREGGAWLGAATRFDLRYRQGIALGEDLAWSLGDFGEGEFNVYYAWDEDADDSGSLRPALANRYWMSPPIERERYALSLRHRWEVSERDTLRASGTYLSDAYVRNDFFRRTMFNWKSQWMGYDNSGVVWEHLENSFSIGAEVSGRLNKFYEMTGRLPEVYFDVNPLPVFDLPVNYEAGNRIGYLTRDPAEYEAGLPGNPFAFKPGVWANYSAFRFDTYHRLTAPFKTLGDVLSVVPRIGYHGTFWDESGEDELDGDNPARDAGTLARSIGEVGATFSARGTAWVDERWQHQVEPYADVLAQKAWMAGSGNRPYAFDSIDASSFWEDQFAGRSRNLPYTYYGVTPGVRNVWEKLDESGRLRQVVDLDVYAALQFGKTSAVGEGDSHRLSRPGRSNYGKDDCYASPGVRFRWMPDDDIRLLSRLEYDSDYNTIAAADLGFQQKVSEDFDYGVTYAVRDFRQWDFSTVPDAVAQALEDDPNWAKMQYVLVEFKSHPIDWFAWGPFVRWDVRRNELDCIGSWFDYLTDCLGFRLLVEYQSAYALVGGYEREEDWSVGFYIYLRAFGPEGSNLFQ